MYNVDMKKVTTEELINYKILPFNIYSEFGEKLPSAGEVLTPGKLLQLRHVENLFRDDDETKNNNNRANKNQEQQTADDILKSLSNNDTRIVEKFDMNPNQTLKSNTVVDEVNIANYKGPINKTSKIDPQNQIKIKSFYHDTINGLKIRSIDESSNLFLNIRDKILQDIIYRASGKVMYSSQIKLIGEYQKCHSLNVAILAGFVARKMDLGEAAISDMVLAGLLHDIGKYLINENILNKQNISNQEQKIIQSHTRLGYKFLKEKMKMPENICLVALEHHENNDGSGYPMNKSGDLISKESQIIHICNYFDNLSFNRTNTPVKNTKDAVRALLELGTKYFMPEALYTFIHMFSYNDTMNFEDMVL